MNELKKYLSPNVAMVVMQEGDIVTVSDPETSNTNDTLFGDIYE